MESIILKVGGMSCQGCVRNVSDVLLAIPGVAEAAVSLEAAQVQIGYDPALTTLDSLRAAIEAAGFDVG